MSNQAKNATAARSLEPTPAPPSVGPSPTAGPDGAVQFAGVTVASALDLTSKPAVTAHHTDPAPGLLVDDLVTGTGAPATPTSTVQVQYVGALYSDGSEFDTTWGSGQPATFSLTQVVAGFAQGIGGTDGVPPMRAGGRRLMVFPAALGYGAVPQQAIPAHSSLVFVVDLQQVS